MKKSVLPILSAALLLSLTGCGGTNAVKIGILQLVTATPLNRVESSFESTMKGSEFAKGNEIEFDLQNPEANDATMTTMASLLAEESDIVLTIATNSTLAVKNAIDKGDNDIPLVFSAVTDAVESGIVSTNEAGRKENITGVSDKGDGTAPFMDELIAGFSSFASHKIGLIYNSTESNSVQQIEEAKAEISAKGWEYEEKTVTKDSEIETVCNSFSAPILYYPTDNLLVSNKAIVSKVAKEKGLIVATSDPSTAETDALVAHGVDYSDIGAAAAEVVERILSGTKASDIAVEVPSGRLVVNETLAEEWGLSLPEALISEADSVL
ncbi:MAG: ABC transporter substrate-binding protein [Bacilli bacterium]|jgi:putative ABC transport system substrate-binding protein|nr:ABC transporter substrate-binding protein [Bacilli bacterium]